MKLHLVFHVSLLNLASLDPVPNHVLPPPPPVEIEGHKELEVEDVLDSSIYYRKPHYVVK